MKPFLKIIAFSFIVITSFAQENAVTNDSPTTQKERLFQRFLKEMQKLDPTNSSLSFTNAEGQASLRFVFESFIVDPSFGLGWDEVPAPTLSGSNSMSAVNLFVATNGWNMQTNDCIFDCIRERPKSESIRGLPWSAIHEKEFPAVTHGHILYVYFKGFHHDGSGVAYNPNTNHFATTIDGFKPIGQHWYVWAFDHEYPQTIPWPKIYEGEIIATNTAAAPK